MESIDNLSKKIIKQMGIKIKKINKLMNNVPEKEMQM